MAEAYVWGMDWLGVWRASTGEYVHGGTPIRTGGSTGYNTLLGFDRQSVMNYINSSKTTTEVYLNIYVTDGGVFDLGVHQEQYNKASNGIPWYAWGEFSWTLYPGWNRLNITNIGTSASDAWGFKTLFSDSGGYKGLVLYGGVDKDYGEAYGITGNMFNAYIEVVGQWNTKPGKPTIVAPTAGQQIEKSFELKANPAVDAEQSASQLRYQWGVYDGVWTYFDLGSYGATNLVVDFDSFDETNRAQVVVRAYDGALYGDWAYSNNFSIVGSHPPDAPTLKSPIGGAEVDRTQDVVFYWTHNDAGQQSKYDFRWRVQGTTDWTTVSRTTTNQFHTVAANTFPEGSIEWNVRTYDSDNLVSPYATNALFVSGAPSGAPIITAPTNGATIPTSRVVVTWSAPDQTSYELQLSQGDTVLWTETVANSEETREIPYDLVNGQSYDIYIRVDTAAGVWSAWAKTSITVSFTAPTVPTITASPHELSGSINVNISNPVTGTEGEPAVSRNEIYRRIYASGEDFVKIVDNVEANGFFTDYNPASGIEYQYIVRAIGENGTSSDSQPVTASVLIENTMLSLTSNPAQFVRLEWNPDRSFTRAWSRSMIQFNGRPYPVAEFGEEGTASFSLSFDIREEETLDILLDLLDSREPLLYRDGRGRKEYMTVGNIQIKDTKFGYSVSFSPEKVDYRESV